MPRVLNSPSTAAPTAMWAARLETWWSARTLTRIAPEVDHGVERLQRPALPLQDGVAHRVGDLRGPSPLRGRTDRGRQVVADIAHRHARAYKLMIIESRPSSRRCPLRTKRGVNEPARHRGGPPVSKGPTSESTVLAALPLPRVGTRRRSRLAPLVAQVIGQLSGQPAFQGLLEQSGEQAIGPSDHRPRPNRSARTSRPTPHRNATAPPHPRPPTRAITSSVITHRSFQIKGIHRQLNTPCGGAGLPLGHGTRSARPSGSAFHSGTTLPAST